MGSRGPKSNYTNVCPGTKKAELLARLLSPPGITSAEAIALGLLPSEMGNCLRSLEDMNGYDIRSAPIHKRRKGAQPLPLGRSQSIYFIVGRHSWDGGYERCEDMEGDDVSK